MILKVLLTSCFRYNSEKKKQKIFDSKNETKQSQYESPSASSDDDDNDDDDDDDDDDNDNIVNLRYASTFASRSSTL